MKKDIENMQDIELLVNSFYDKVKQDDLIGPIFNDVARVNWEKHLPIMYDFWENILFATGRYSGNPMVSHARLHEKFPLNEEHFERWTEIFLETVDLHFEGQKAELAKLRASSIAVHMFRRVTEPRRPLSGL